jgi:biopolymer transport protein TolQ
MSLAIEATLVLALFVSTGAIAFWFVERLVVNGFFLPLRRERMFWDVHIQEDSAGFSRFSDILQHFLYLIAIGGSGLVAFLVASRFADRTSVHYYAAIVGVVLSWSVALSIDEYLIFAREKREAAEILTSISRSGDLEKIEAELVNIRKSKSAIVAAVADHILEHRTGGNQSDNEVSEYYDRRRMLLDRISSAAPFFGLMGTVFGITDAFFSLSGAESDLRSVAKGVSTALISTVIGLLVAIPGLLIANLLAGKTRKLVEDGSNQVKKAMTLMSR